VRIRDPQHADPDYLLSEPKTCIGEPMPSNAVRLVLPLPLSIGDVDDG
jgi:hypothetical protein